MALLRGINVGGKNIVPMARLRAEFETAGYTDVSTYIQSGNVLFTADAPADGLEPAIERVLAERVGCPVMVMVRSHRALADVVGLAPNGFGADPDRLADVVFLKGSLDIDRAMGVVSLREGVDRAWPGDGVLYFDRLAERRTQSHLSKLVSTPEYRQMTIRNWATTTRLLALLGAGTG